MIKHFNYYLTGTGWAEAFFSNDKQNVRFELSYLSDPLLDIFQGLCRLIYNQSDTEKIVFAEEPGEHSLVISKQDEGTIKVEIFWSDEWETISNALKTSSSKETVYSDKDTVVNFASVICLGIDSLLERMTLAEYKEKWNLSEFPIEGYNRLREAIKLT